MGTGSQCGGWQIGSNSLGGSEQRDPVVISFWRSYGCRVSFVPFVQMWTALHIIIGIIMYTIQKYSWKLAAVTQSCLHDARGRSTW